MTGMPWLSVLIVLPALGALFLAAWRPADAGRARGIALMFSGLTLVLVLGLSAQFAPSASGVRWEERHRWIPGLGAEYHLGLDGLGWVPVLLSSLLVPFAILLSREIPGRPAAYFAWMLLLEAALLGAFTALNFLHWFLFWELSLVPAFFLVQGWGGKGSRGAALQFFAYTFMGSVGMLVAMLGIFLATGTLDLIRLGGMGGDGSLATAVVERFGSLGLDPMVLRCALAGGVFAGLAVKLPVVPLHTWLPPTYAAAPTPVTVLLTGALSKLGVYGLLRLLLPLFPGEMRAMANPLLALAVLTIVAPALAALRETRWKRILAYSSVNHLGYCLLGVVAAALAGPRNPAGGAAVAGVVLQMFNHGIIAAVLFGLVAQWEARTGDDDSSGTGGLRAAAPVFSGLIGVAMFASLGLPGLSGFVGEFLIFRGAFAVAPLATGAALLGLLATAFLLVGAYQRAFAGPLSTGPGGFRDLAPREWALLVPGVVLMVVPGFLPGVILAPVNPWIRALTAALANP